MLARRIFSKRFASTDNMESIFSDREREHIQKMILTNNAHLPGWITFFASASLVYGIHKQDSDNVRSDIRDFKTEIKSDIEKFKNEIRLDIHEIKTILTKLDEDIRNIKK